MPTSIRHRFATSGVTITLMPSCSRTSALPVRLDTARFPCFAMGSPAGLSQSVTRGIISNVAMISPMSGSFRLDGENVGELVRWLGHDAVIFPGNSGGPLVNERGEIIGINEVGIGSLGGAIPSNLAQEVSQQLAEKGFVARCWTGLECQPVLNPSDTGILVAGVTKDSPAHRAGIKPGDIIKSINKKPVNDIYEYMKRIESIKKGESINVDIKRDEKIIMLTVRF